MPLHIPAPQHRPRPRPGFAHGGGGGLGGVTEPGSQIRNTGTPSRFLPPTIPASLFPPWRKRGSGAPHYDPPANHGVLAGLPATPPRSLPVWPRLPLGPLSPRPGQPLLQSCLLLNHGGRGSLTTPQRERLETSPRAPSPGLHLSSDGPQHELLSPGQEQAGSRTFSARSVAGRAGGGRAAPPAT